MLTFLSIIEGSLWVLSDDINTINSKKEKNEVLKHIWYHIGLLCGISLLIGWHCQWQLGWDNFHDLETFCLSQLDKSYLVSRSTQNKYSFGRDQQLQVKKTKSLSDVRDNFFFTSHLPQTLFGISGRKRRIYLISVPRMGDRGLFMNLDL